MMASVFASFSSTRMQKMSNMALKRYLLTLNNIQSACLAGGEDNRSIWFCISGISRFVRRDLIHLYMVRRDYDQALDFLRDPIFRDRLRSNSRLLRDLQFVVDSIYIIENDREIVDIATDLHFRCMDAIRMAASLTAGLDGIVTLEPLDFVDNPLDSEEMRAHGEAAVLIGELENIESGIDPVRVFVTSPFVLVENIYKQIGAAFDDDFDIHDEPDINNDTSVAFTRLRLSHWNLIMGQEGLERICVELEDQFGVRQYFDSSESDEPTLSEQLMSSLGEVDALFLVINACAEQFVKLPDFYLSYTVTSAQGVPSPVKVEIGLIYLGGTFSGVCSGNSTIECTASAYLKALNKVLWYRECGQ